MSKIIIFIPLLVTLVIVVALIFTKTNSPECIKSHTETRHRKAWTQMIPIKVGGVRTYSTIRHPAKDYEVTVCDEYKEQN